MMFISNLWKNPKYFICWIVMIVFSICIHEFTHAFVALKQGDDTAARNGYLTLDPMRLMGLPALVSLAFLGFSWGAVPVCPTRMKYRWSPALVAFAGPLSNFALACFFALFSGAIAKLVPESGVQAGFLYFLFFGIVVNCFLFLFNVLPIPMLDGYQVASLFVPKLAQIPNEKQVSIGWGIILVVFITGWSRYLFAGASFLALKLELGALSCFSFLGS